MNKYTILFSEKDSILQELISKTIQIECGDCCIDILERNPLKLDFYVPEESLAKLFKEIQNVLNSIHTKSKFSVVEVTPISL